MDKLIDIAVVFAFATGLVMLARFAKNRIAQSWTKYVANESTEIPPWLLGLGKATHIARESGSADSSPLHESATGKSQDFPDWLKTETPETVRVHLVLDKTLGGASIGAVSGMMIAVWQTLQPGPTWYWIIVGTVIGAIVGVTWDAEMMRVAWNAELPRGARALIGAIAGGSAAAVVWAIDIGVVSKLFGIVVGAGLGAIVGWTVSWRDYR